MDNSLLTSVRFVFFCNLLWLCWSRIRQTLPTLAHMWKASWIGQTLSTCDQQLFRGYGVRACLVPNQGLLLDLIIPKSLRNRGFFGHSRIFQSMASPTRVHYGRTGASQTPSKSFWPRTSRKMHWVEGYCTYRGILLKLTMVWISPNAKLLHSPAWLMCEMQLHHSSSLHSWQTSTNMFDVKKQGKGSCRSVV